MKYFLNKWMYILEIIILFNLVAKINFLIFIRKKNKT